MFRKCYTLLWVRLAPSFPTPMLPLKLHIARRPHHNKMHNRSHFRSPSPSRSRSLDMLRTFHSLTAPTSSHFFPQLFNRAPFFVSVCVCVCACLHTERVCLCMYIFWHFFGYSKCFQSSIFTRDWICFTIRNCLQFCWNNMQSRQICTHVYVCMWKVYIHMYCMCVYSVKLISICWEVYVFYLYTI